MMAVWEAEYSIRRKDGKPITKTVGFGTGDEKVTLTRTGKTYLISPLEVLSSHPHFDIEVIQKNSPYKSFDDRAKIQKFVGNSAFESNIRKGSFILKPKNEELRKLLTEEDESVWNSDWEYEEPYPVREIVLELTEEGGEGIGFPSYMAWAIYWLNSVRINRGRISKIITEPTLDITYSVFGIRIMMGGGNHEIPDRLRRRLREY